MKTDYEMALERAIEYAMKLSVMVGLFLSYFAVFCGCSIEQSFFLGLLIIIVTCPILILSAVAWVSLIH